MKILSVITARGGSKGIPGKNIKPLGGKPLIAWTIEASLKSKYVSRTIISTDDDTIAEVCVNYGAEVPFRRPEELSRDDTPHLPVIQHAVKYLEEKENDFYDYILLPQPTSPFRTAEDIDNAAKILIEKQPDAMVSVCEMEHHPFFARKINPDGVLELFIKRPEGSCLRRQELPGAYTENGAMFFMKRDVLMKEGLIMPEDRTMAFIMPQERSIDIDSPWNFYLADMIMEDKSN